jgi:hypothetical protein
MFKLPARKLKHQAGKSNIGAEILNIAREILKMNHIPEIPARKFKNRAGK